ncbi:homoserine kinase [Alcanivorax sp. JB21]|uniref:homoserine kinase n=1 Tax=Alcanivorax limicola TaxID=2874102 RepID=UPI001CBFBE19|nr:homoserine kinase [Alcanivorax limicola]MBZ2188766.1 homoserine kinase [Alcanivorax limicola]
MTVFTPLSNDQIQQLLSRDGLTLVRQRPIVEGIENSNFMLEARRANGIPVALVLTVFETLTAEALPWFIDLLQQLAHQGLPVAAPLGGKTALMTVADKPALLVPRLSGSHIQSPDTSHCATVGALLARLHSQPLPPPGPAPDPNAQLSQLVTDHLDKLPTAQQEVAGKLLQRWHQHEPAPVLCHGDLFRDNVLFNGEQLTGMLDFYNAGAASAEFDIAIAMNDWCVDATGRPDPTLETALLDGYQHERPLGTAARMRLPLALAIAALRFWLSRLGAPPSEQAIGQGSKDPEEFARLFARRAAAL